MSWNAIKDNREGALKTVKKNGGCLVSVYALFVIKTTDLPESGVGQFWQCKEFESLFLNPLSNANVISLVWNIVAHYFEFEIFLGMDLQRN